MGVLSKHGRLVRGGALAIAAHLLIAGCATVYEGEYEARVVATVRIDTPSFVNETVETTERVEFPEGDMEINEVLLERHWADGPPCLLRGRKRGGFGLTFLGGDVCSRGGTAWTLTGGRAPNESSDELVIDLEWTISGTDPPSSGVASETLFVSL